MLTVCDAAIRPFPTINPDVTLRCELHAGHPERHEAVLRDYAYPGSETNLLWSEGDRRTFHGDWPGACDLHALGVPLHAAARPPRNLHAMNDQPLGKHFQPAPASWRWAKVTLADGSTRDVLAFETVAGVFGVVMEPEALRNLARQCLDRAGLVIATNDIIPPRQN